MALSAPSAGVSAEIGLARRDFAIRPDLGRPDGLATNQEIGPLEPFAFDLDLAALFEPVVILEGSIGPICHLDADPPLVASLASSLRRVRPSLAVSPFRISALTAAASGTSSSRRDRARSVR
jgi:hypothetical protein